MKQGVIGPSLLMAAGVIASTAVAVVASESRWLMLGAPLVMTLTMVAAAALGGRRKGSARGAVGLAVTLGIVLLAATAIIAFADSHSVAVVMPILASGVAYPVISSLENDRRTRGKCARSV